MRRLTGTIRRQVPLLWLFMLIAPVLAIMPTASPRTAEAKYASIVVDASTGKILHEVKGDARRHPASLTKMMTLYELFGALDSRRVRKDTRLAVSSRAAKQPPSKLGLKAGQSITVDQAIRALVTKSANDVATVVAEGLAGSESQFARRMTRTARNLGMSGTTFRNASGLHHPAQLSTARDMVKLSQALMKHYPHHYHYFGDKAFSFGGKTYRNHNKLLANYAGADGLKTGYVKQSGFNIAVTARRQGRRLVAVVFGGKNARTRDKHAMRLLDKGFMRNAPAARIVQPTPGPSESDRPAPGTTLWAKPWSVSLPEPSAFIIDSATAGTGSKRAAAPARAAGSANRGDVTDWGIQVGAFSRYAPAHLAVTQATRRAPSLLMRGKVSILPIDRQGGKLYRARLMGLSKNTARQACQVLERSRIPCLAVAPAES